MKKNNKKGFTMAELLIVVAIIAVLVAIAVPVFTTQLNKAKLATATANARSITAEYVADCLAPDSGEPTVPSVATLNTKFTAAALGVTGATASASATTHEVTVTYDGKTQTFPIDTSFTA